ncbi:hypothetical protein Tco_1546392 [Tanacetum coccineum]
MKLDERLSSLDIDMDMELFPYTLTVVAVRRWVIGHSFHLAAWLEARIEHGKAGRDLEDIRAYDDLEALKYSSIELLMASLTLEGSHGEEDQSIEFCRLQSVEEQLTVPVYFERGGSCVPDSWDREILLHDALAAFRTKGEKKKKKDALLYLVIYEAFAVVVGSQPSSLAPSIQALMVDVSMVTTTLILAIDPSKVVSEAARDGSALTVVVSQGPSIIATDYHISDLNVDGVEIQNDNDDMFDSSLLDKPEDHQTSAPK